MDDIRSTLADHFTQGECSKNAPIVDACSEVHEMAGSDSGNIDDIQAYVLTVASYSISHKQAFTVLHRQNIHVDSSMTLSKLRRMICDHMRSLQKEKQPLLRSFHEERHHGSKHAVTKAHLNQIWNQWLQLIPKSLKDKIADMFCKEGHRQMVLGSYSKW